MKPYTTSGDYRKDRASAEAHWAEQHESFGGTVRAPRHVFFCLLDHRHFHKRCKPGCTIPEGQCNPSIKTIAAKTGYSTKQVQRALRWLTEHSYVAIYEQRVKHEHGEQITHLYYGIMGFTAYVPLDAQPANRDPEYLSRKYGAKNPTWRRKRDERRAQKAAHATDTASPPPATTCHHPTDIMSPGVPTPSHPNLGLESELNLKWNLPPKTAGASLASGEEQIAATQLLPEKNPPVSPDPPTAGDDWQPMKLEIKDWEEPYALV